LTTNSTERLTSAEYWRRYGAHALMAMPYADQVLVEGRGCTIRDADGQELLDLAAGMFCCVLGHNHPEFTRRIVEQTHALIHTGTQFISPAVLEAGYKLAQVLPEPLTQSVFLSTGTEANEFAFRLAKTFTGRTGIVGFSRGYYGTSLATKSVSGLFSHHLRDSLPIVPDSFRIPIPEKCESCFRQGNAGCELSCLRTVEELIGGWSHVAAIVVEPTMSAGGMLTPPPGYLMELQRIARRNGVLLIVDEAQTGFGRTGKWFAFEHHGIQPDILTLSKSAGNGFPVAVVSTSTEIADEVIARGFWHLSSHQSDPVGAAAVSAVIDIVREEKLVEHAATAGEYFMDRLRALTTKQPWIGNVRGQGLMIGFDLLTPDSESIDEKANDFMYACRRRGVHLTFGYGCRAFRIIPPLVISTTEIDRAVQVIDDSLTELGTRPHAELRAYWPGNPYTSALWKKNRAAQFAGAVWRSSPEKWFQRAKEIVGKTQRSGAR
jgi:2,2-dialkylglycine decarboxylase (pyruvate)